MVKKKSDNNTKERILKFTATKKRYVTIEEICMELKISRPTAIKYINQLINEGWLEEGK